MEQKIWRIFRRWQKSRTCRTEVGHGAREERVGTRFASGSNSSGAWQSDHCHPKRGECQPEIKEMERWKQTVNLMSCLFDKLLLLASYN